MARTFENSGNGHREEVNGGSSAGAFFFGLFYFAFKGIWRHFIIQLLLIVLFIASLGPPGTMFAFVMWIVYAAMAQNIVAANYLRNGWREVTGATGQNHSENSPPALPATPGADEKACPFCAETVKKAAIKCRHCGSSLDSLVTQE